MAQLIWTAEARWWLQEMHDYLARDSPKAADRIVRGVRARAQKLLLASPESGKPYQPRRFERVRAVLYGRYRIFYQRERDGDVHVLGIFAGPQAAMTPRPTPPAE